MTTTKSYDYLDRLTSISSANASSVVLDSHGYSYNTANQRTAATNVDNSTWNYQYDGLGQVTSGKKYWSDGSLVAGEQFGYAFDDIGNRITTQAGGSEFGANLRYANYTVNNLNQYTNRTVSGAVDLIGSATNTSTVTVNLQPSYRKSNFYRTQLALTNAAGAVWQSVTNLAVLNMGTDSVTVASNIGNIFLPQTPESFTYDTDGNLTQDGRWNYTWDAENRLIDMTSLSGGPSGSKLELNFAYDFKGRRVQKTVSSWDGFSYVSQLTNRFAYDGWNVLAIIDPSFSVTESFVWGLDLSGRTQGVGGVGGLLKVSSVGTNCFVAYDGNGNVSALVNGLDGTSLAQYEYGPLGELIRTAGPMAKNNPFRFSTKYRDDETDFLYYGYRYCNLSIGKWLSRDPIDESGGVNLYEVCGNNTINQFDSYGLETYDFDKDAYYVAVAFKIGDILIWNGAPHTVTSGNQWPFAPGTGLAKIKCLLSKLGFTLPPPPNPVYMATFNDKAGAWTLFYGFPYKKRPTFFDADTMNHISKVNADLMAVTMWHELVGHNLNGESDSAQFDLKYEKPVNDAINKARNERGLCGLCATDDGPDWKINTRFDVYMCQCGINPPPSSTRKK